MLLESITFTFTDFMIRNLIKRKLKYRLEKLIAFTVSIFDHCVNDVTCFKYLGILISSDFTWSNHVEYMEGKINRSPGLHGALLIFEVLFENHIREKIPSIKIIIIIDRKIQTNQKFFF